MEIRIDRQWKKEGYTISRVYINGEYFGCNALEDTDRGLTSLMSEKEITKRKLYGQTAIPSGTYNVIYTYSPRYKKHLPLLENVKGFTGIRVHYGNSAKDTEGCIMFGKNDKIGWISNSKLWTDRIIAKMQEAWIKKEKVTMKIG